MKIQIKAADALFFRDGKPFDLGEDTWANGMFPDIAPGVLLGALRAVYASRERLDRKEISVQTKLARISEYGLCLNDCAVFSIPLDLIESEGVTTGLELVTNGMTSNPFSFLLCSPANIGKSKGLDGQRIGASDLSDYLNGNTQFDVEDDFFQLMDYTTSEPKIGIGRDRHTNTAREGALYRVNMVRLEGAKEDNHASFWVDIDDLELYAGELMRLGAENKIARVTEFAFPHIIIHPTDWTGESRFKLLLSSPAIFEAGVLPDWIGADMTGELPGLGIDVRLLTCAVGRALSFGGFDLENYKPKPMMKAVPAGSVYYFELLDAINAPEHLAQIVQYFGIERNPISEIRTNEGLGRVFVGKIKQKV
jgi:CRISPR-associated protein Cmr3